MEIYTTNIRGENMRETCAGRTAVSRLMEVLAVAEVAQARDQSEQCSAVSGFAGGHCSPTNSAAIPLSLISPKVIATCREKLLST